MKDFPVFTTEYGVASLTLREIPYREEAYIRIQAAQEPKMLLEECKSFCRACGAESVYAAGHDILESYPFHTAIWRMCRLSEGLEESDAALWPVLPENAEQWRKLYNGRMKSVPNASFMTLADAEQMLQDGDGYFVHRGGELLGIGRASGEEIRAIVSAKPGAGETVLKTLALLLSGDRIVLEVASENIPAVRLYRRLGFEAVCEISRWYQIF